MRDGKCLMLWKLSFPLNLNVNSFSTLPLLSLNHLSIFLAKTLQPISFHTKLTNLEKRLSFDIFFKLLDEPKWHCDTQSLNKIINLSLTTLFLRYNCYALTKSINSCTRGIYIACFLIRVICRSKLYHEPGEYFFALSSLIFASTSMASWTCFSYVKGFQ